MFSQSFICDLRCTKDDLPLKASFLDLYCDALCEYFFFLASTDSFCQNVISLKLYLINSAGKLFELIRGTDFSLESLFEVLKLVKLGTFGNQIETEQDPLTLSLDLCSFDQSSSIIITLFSDFPYKDKLEKTINRIILTLPDSKLTFLIIDESTKNETCPLASLLATLPHTQILQIQNTDECYFQFFRSLINDLLYPPRKEVLKIGSHVICCEMIQLFQNVVLISTNMKCKCHKMPTISGPVHRCNVTHRILSQSQLLPNKGIGKFDFDIKNEINSTSQIKILCRVSFEEVSESFTTGNSIILRSGSGIFHRLLTELRLKQEVLIAQKEPTKVIGGEFWVFCPDKIKGVLVGKQICNRIQILHLDIEEIEQEDVYTKPILDEIEKGGNVFPFFMGRNNLKKMIID